MPQADDSKNVRDYSPAAARAAAGMTAGPGDDIPLEEILALLGWRKIPSVRTDDPDYGLLREDFLDGLRSLIECVGLPRALLRPQDIRRDWLRFIKMVRGAR
ncbi:MAG: hypothetical protein LBP95_12865 [Deltaproteobacteria bacterium]|jgi:hypothetical protein|nr:hypothetical protein [Deltaproteobacteria bacterium]